MAGPKSVFEMVHIAKAEIAKEIIYHELWRNRFVYFETHLLT